MDFGSPRAFCAAAMTELASWAIAVPPVQARQIAAAKTVLLTMNPPDPERGLYLTCLCRFAGRRMSLLFTIQDRDRVRDHVLDRARTDARVVAGAVVGSLARSDGDRWSDLDLTFGVADGFPIDEVL